MKLPKIEEYSSYFPNENKRIIDKNLLNYLKIIKNPFQSLHKYFDTEKKSISLMNLKKKNIEEESKIIPSNSCFKSSSKDNIFDSKKIKIIKRPYNHRLYMVNSDNVNEINNHNNYYNDSLHSENRAETLLNIKSYVLNDKIEDYKFPLPVVQNIPKKSKGVNTINQSDFLNGRHNKMKREHSMKIIRSGFEESKNSKQIHNYNIKFNNSFLKNINWNNNILKKLLKEKKFKINLGAIKNFKLRNQKESSDKEKEKKNPITFKSYNEIDSSYFNSEINDFYNNCKYKNNKLILSLMKERNINKSKKVYLSIFNENIYNNYCAFNMNQKNLNPKIYNLSSEKTIKKNRIISCNNSVYKLKI